MDISHIPIIDHHAHLIAKPSYLQGENDFVRIFTESTDKQVREKHAVHTIYFLSSIHRLSEFLDCDEGIVSIIKARNAIPFTDYLRKLFTDANIISVFCDYGYNVKEGYCIDEFMRILPCKVSSILRIETVAEQLMAQYDSLERVSDEFTEIISNAANSGHVALKTIIAYRTGLKQYDYSKRELIDAFDGYIRNFKGRTGRLHSAPLNAHFLKLALEANLNNKLPFQFHVGYGDDDIDLCNSNPLELRGMIKGYDFPFVILHAGWPYVRESSYLASVYRNVYIDLSLTIPQMTTGIGGILSDILGIVPHSKILFGTDASYLPEAYWLAAKSIRFELGGLLDKFIDAKYVRYDYAYTIAENILNKNAIMLYRI